MSRNLSDERLPRPGRLRRALPALRLSDTRYACLMRVTPVWQIASGAAPPPPPPAEEAAEVAINAYTN